MKLPKFSILTATRNCLPYVGKCIRSVIAQDTPEWEMIIIDDCSTDNTFKRACEISKKHKNIKVVRNDDRLYCGPNYKKALSMAQGTYCGILDGDDTLFPYSVSTIIDQYEKHPEVDFIWTKHVWWNTEMTRNRGGLSSKPKAGTIYDSENGLRHVYSHWRTFKTELREKTDLFNDLRCSVDKNLGYSLESVGRGGFFPKALYNYRYHKANMSHHNSHHLSQKSTWRSIRESHKNDKRFESKVVR